MNDDFSENLIEAGFHRLDPKLVEARPPKIRWGTLYRNGSIEARLAFAEKVASAMNHAASLIQGERDELLRLCALKEEQLSKLSEAMRANDAMLQGEVTRMNAQRQAYNERIADLNRKLRERGNHR